MSKKTKKCKCSNISKKMPNAHRLDTLKKIGEQIRIKKEVVAEIREDIRELEEIRWGIIVG